MNEIGDVVYKLYEIIHENFLSAGREKVIYAQVLVKEELAGLYQRK